MRNVIILGAGSFATEIVDEIDNNLEVICYVVQDEYYHNQPEVIPLSKFKNGYKEIYYLCPIVSTQRKQFIEQFYRQVKIPSITFIHKSVYLSKMSAVKSGSIICPNVTIASNSIIRNHCIINRGTTIGHDCLIESYSTIGPGVNIAGNVCIGSQTTIGLGTNILEGRTIGNNCVVGAGALVTKDIPDGQTWYGVPAHHVR